MSMTRTLRRKMSFFWLALERAFTMIADQLSRQMEGIRADYQLREQEGKMDLLFEKTGKFFHAEHRKGSTLNELSALDGVSHALSEYKRLDLEIKLLEQKKFLMQEEEAADYWAEFIDLLTRSGMTIERFSLPASFSSTTLENIAPPEGVRIIAVLRNKRIVEPSAENELKANDQVIVIGPISQIVLLMQRYSITPKSTR